MALLVKCALEIDDRPPVAAQMAGGARGFFSRVVAVETFRAVSFRVGLVIERYGRLPVARLGKNDNILN